MHRRLASIKVNDTGNSQEENAPDAYEMLSGRNSQPTYSTIHVQSEAGAPATFRNATQPVGTGNGKTQPSASPRRSNHDYLTPIDNTYVNVQ